MRLLVTGAGGFVGKNFLRGVPDAWAVTAVTRDSSALQTFCDEHALAHVRVISLDLCDQRAVASALGSESFDVCVHLAGHGDPRAAAEHPSVDLAGNVTALLTLLESGVRIGRFIHFSSGAVYEGHTGSVNAQTPIRPYTPYSIAKFAAEQYTKHFRARNVINGYVIVRFFGCYGSYEPERKLYRRLVRAFGVGHDDSITLYGDGSNTIYAMYAADAVTAILAMVQSDTSDVTVDLCGPEALTIREVAMRATGVFKTHASLNFTGEVPVERHVFSVSNRAFREAFGFEPKTSLVDGLHLYKEAVLRGE